MTSRSLRAVGPAPLSLSDLRRLTAQIAGRVQAGEYEVHINPERRWYRQLSCDGYVDVWLISWCQEQGAELHDHAGSLGALTVVRGQLTEQRWSPARRKLVTRVLDTGTRAGFPLGHVHDVSNRSEAPAVSVHAYSPPLTAMSFYRVEPDGRLRRTRSELTTETEVATA